MLGIISSRWALLAQAGGSCWVHKGFWKPICWYCQRECLALGVLPNANPQRKGFHVAVEYRLYRWLMLAYLDVGITYLCLT